MIEINKISEQDYLIFVELCCELEKFNCINKYGQIIEAKINAKAEEANFIFSCINGDDMYAFFAKDTQTNKIVGYIIGRIIIDEQIKSEDEEIGLIDELFVIENYRRKGIAKQLIQRLEQEFQKKEIAFTKLHAYAWNENARTFYTELDYQEYAITFTKKL